MAIGMSDDHSPMASPNTVLLRQFANPMAGSVVAGCWL